MVYKMLILYTGTHCPKCPDARKVVREVAKELGWIEGKDFVEKLIDGQDIKPGEFELEGEKFIVVKTPEEIDPQKGQHILAGDDFSIEALTYQIASTPSIVFNEQPIFNGKVPSKEELLEAVKG